MRVPRPVVVLLLLTLVPSIAAAFDPNLYHRLALIPDDVWRGEVWRLFTWPFVELGPISIAMGCVIIFWSGTSLISAWGERRFSRYVALVLAVAGVGTLVFSLVLPSAGAYGHLAGFALDSALVIAWALTFPDRQLRIYGVLPVGGKPLAHGIAAMHVLFVVFWGLTPFLPEVLAIATALLFMNPTVRTRLRRFAVHRGGRHGGPYYS
jgi:membrane associated rhomboid family serine protease